ncbi:glycosyltransferase [Actinopolymorpha sp. B17G11]|uniref:glycosyltransferase n=1 Tax=Actinopolymorpha sp. B17G11 TaxID=3160861 RepID=UPI0032E36FC9
MHIAQLANFYGPSSGGLRTAIDALGRGYVEAGHRRSLLVPGPYDAWEETEHGLVVTFRAPLLPGTSYRMVPETWRIRDVLDRLRPTNVEVSDKLTMTTAASWARRHDGGSVLLSHERLDTHLSPRIGWRPGLVAGVNLLNRSLLRRFDQVVVTSAFAAREFERVAVRPVRQVALGVDLTTFHPDRASPAATRANGGTAATGAVGAVGAAGAAGADRDGEVPRLIHAGRLSQEKRPDLAVATAVELHRQGFAFRLDVFGDGPDRAALQDLAGDAPVVFHPYVGDRLALAAELAAADVSLSVCPFETFGLAILEALACGTPVVTADTGGGRELVTLASGAWAKPDPRALAAAVTGVLARDRDARRKAAREQAECYPWSASVSAMLDVHAATGRRARVRTSGRARTHT